jgi:hypothetical protein
MLVANWKRKSRELTQGDRSRRSHVLIAMSVNHCLEVIRRDTSLILQNVVVDRSSCTLNGRVGRKIWKLLEARRERPGNILLTEVILERMSNITLD